MPGVKIVERDALHCCYALTDVECGTLEIIKEHAFANSESLRNANFPSARIVEETAFWECYNLTKVKFGNMLERIEGSAFYNCFSLERISIPLKDGIITDDSIFHCCSDLRHVDLVEGELQKTTAALHLEDWRTDMIGEIDSIHQILPNASAGYSDYDDYDNGEKAQVIRRWVRSVLRKIICYQEEHQRVLDEAVSTLQLDVPQDILMNNVLSFLKLPAHTFEMAGEEESEDELEVEY
jgi:hypothetical protein